MNATTGGSKPEIDGDEVTGDDHRSRTGIILLVLGVLLLLWAWGSFVFRTSDAGPDAGPDEVPSEVRAVQDHTETESQL